MSEPPKFAWCQDVIDDILKLRRNGVSYTNIATIMQENGIFLTRNSIAGLLYREARGGLKTGARLKATPAEP